MRLLAIGMALFALQVTGPSHAEMGRESGEELLARCEPAMALLDPSGAGQLTQEQREAGLGCIAFVDGFIWGHAWAAWRERSDMYYCPPEGFSPREAVPAIVGYLRQEPDRLVQRAHLLVFAALSRAFPCQAPPSTTP